MKTIDLDSIKIHPISTQEDFEKANEIIEALIDADMIEDEQQQQKALAILNAVTVLAVDYEKKHFPVPPPNPIEAIKQRMEMLNLSQKELAKYFGGENRVSEVLNKKRPLTLKMIRNLYYGLGIPAEVLLSTAET